MERNRHAWKLLMFLFFTVGHAVCGEVIKSGTDHTFKPSITGNPQTILWKYKGNKVVESEINEPYWYRLIGRAELNTTTGDFTLMKLNKDDSGLYESEIQVAGVMRSSTHDIEVIGHAVCGEVICLKSGTDYTFKPSITGNPETILWKYQGEKVVEFENNEPYWYRLKGRAELNTTTGDLTLMKLNKEDSGRYESEIQVRVVIQSSSHDIEVIDAVPKPNVTCEVNDTEAKLVCSVDSSADFKWIGPDVDGKPGQTITVPKEGSHEAVYICIVTNGVSKNIAVFHLKDCFGDEASSATAAPLVVSLVAVLIAALLVLFYCSCWTRNREEQELDMTFTKVEYVGLRKQ